MPLDETIQPIRSKRKPNLPTVLSQEEIQRFFCQIKGTHALMAKLLYGSGLRLMECVRLRIMDIDFDRKRIRVLGKGGKQRSKYPTKYNRHLEHKKCRLFKVTYLSGRPHGSPNVVSPENRTL